VLDELRYRRYEWKRDALNAASIAPARRLGFCDEGAWRAATIYQRRNRDIAWFSVTDHHWTVLRLILQKWLALKLRRRTATLGTVRDDSRRRWARPHLSAIGTSIPSRTGLTFR